MALYVRLVEPSVKGTAATQGHIEQVYSPDDATVFTYGDAQYFRQRAFEHWSNFNWEIEKVAADKYRVSRHLRNYAGMRKRVIFYVLFLLPLSARPINSAKAQAQQPTQPTPSSQQFLDQVYLMVAPIEIWCGASRMATATGFFFENDGRLFLITNRHVVRQDDPTRNEHFFPDKLTVRLHANAQDHSQNANYDIPLYRDKKSVWRETPGVDLVAIELLRRRRGS